MDDSPVAMPTPFGYIQPQTLAQVIEKYQKGMEDPGDVLARQIGGSHYKKAHQPWEIIEEWGLDYWAGNVVKYILRYKFKNGVEDLEKAKHYLEYLIKKEKDAIAASRN